uniref:Septin-type G domain-containing protein n=1 Tax=Latimeria chalumnae TaxID=7897 RepID=H2ZYX9_LATCH
VSLRKEPLQDSKSTRCIFGNKSGHTSNKVIMVLGATGSGKTTLINGMFNYILGVDWEDDFRFKLINEVTNKSQAESQTSEITAYETCCPDFLDIPYHLTIVDTPGFGDTRGIEHDKHITKQIANFFSAKDGVDIINAICFVVQAPLVRLTSTQKYIFESILSIFGKDIAEKINFFVTFADNQKPAVLEAIRVGKVPCAKDEKGFPVYYKFNNSTLFAKKENNSEEEESEFNKLIWKMGSKSMGQFFQNLTTMEPQSLVLTKEVLAERKQIETVIRGLDEQIKVALLKVDELTKTKAALEKLRSDENLVKDFEVPVKVTEKVREKSNNFATNCNTCETTCHSPCSEGWSNYLCTAMDIWGSCRVCTDHCASSSHSNEKYIWVYAVRNKMQTVEDLKQKYLKAHGEKLSVEKLCKELEKEVRGVLEELKDLFEKYTKSLKRLDEIALRPNPLTDEGFINMMIAAEKQERKEGYEERIASLEKLKKAETLTKKLQGIQEILTKLQSQV